MKLIQCHIDNFGKLQNFDYKFTDGLNNLKEANGWGKTTFVTFIKAMFYGIPSSRKTNLDENERKKYTPWQGGNFGGNLEFEVQNKHYRIERQFDKSDKNDVFNLIDLTTGKKSHAYSSNIGIEIFGLDEAAFERSLYIPQKLLNANPNESITNKLNAIIHGTAESYSLETALANLDKKRKSLHNQNKTGSIQKIEQKINDIVAQIAELRHAESAIIKHEQQITSETDAIEKLTTAKQQIDSQIKTYNVIAEKKANQSLLTNYVAAVEDCQTKIIAKQKIINHSNTNLAEVENYLAREADLTRLEMLRDTNHDRLPARRAELLEYFGGEKAVPTAEQVQTIATTIDQYNALKINVAPVQPTIKKTASNKLPLVLLALAVVCVIGGMVVLKPAIIVAISLFVGGVVLLLAAAFVYFRQMIKSQIGQPNAVNYAQFQANQLQFTQLQNQIVAFIGRFEPDENNFSNALYRIKLKIDELTQIEQQLTARQSDDQTLNTQITQMNAMIENYLSGFNFPVHGWGRRERLDCVKHTLQTLNELTTELNIKQAALDQFKATNAIDDTAVIPDIDSLQVQAATLQNQIDEHKEIRARSQNLIENLQNNLERLDDLETEKAHLETEREELNRQFTALKNAEKYLQSANDSLSAQYLAPMKNNLLKYLQLITGQNFQNLQLSTDFEISFNEDGFSREINYYSIGYQNAINLAMRLALIDTLFRTERPFIVLDDPFVNLDETKIDLAKAFLQKLGQTYQIIYLSCHSSRC